MATEQQVPAAAMEGGAEHEKAPADKASCRLPLTDRRARGEIHLKPSERLSVRS